MEQLEVVGSVSSSVIVSPYVSGSKGTTLVNWVRYSLQNPPMLGEVGQYCILPSKGPWVLEIHGPKTGVGAYTKKPVVHVT